MNQLELKNHLTMGREIEFSFRKIPYFMSKIWGSSENDIEQYFIRNCKEGKDVFVGTLDDLLSFCFFDDIALGNHIDQFVFEYIF